MAHRGQGFAQTPLRAIFGLSSTGHLPTVLAHEYGHAVLRQWNHAPLTAFDIMAPAENSAVYHANVVGFYTSRSLGVEFEKVYLPLVVR